MVIKVVGVVAPLYARPILVCTDISSTVPATGVAGVTTGYRLQASVTSIKTDNIARIFFINNLLGLS